MDLLLTPIWHNSCGSSLVNKQVAYGYDEDFLTHQPRVVFDMITSLPYNLYWDLNGNLTEVSNCKLGSARFHDWDEENRLHAVAGPSYAGFYGYDGNGNRVWKLTGSCSCSSQNGDDMVYSVTVDDGVIYPNPYITITPQGYTKHYYVGQERFATALGLGGWNIEPVAQNAREVDISHDWFGHFEEYYPFGEITSSTTNNLGRTGDAPVELQYECNSPMQLYSLHVLWDYDMFNTCIYSYLGAAYAPDEIFYIHPDHLGSASWITNKYAEPEQYIHYAPYGELLANQQVNTYDERYKFTGKERDAESGYDYFGARFLAQQLGIWLSVDPWSDIYPFISPYAYCFGNPIILFDPNGCGDPLTVMKVRKMLIKNTFGMVRTKYDENGKIVPKPHQGIDYYAPEGTDVMAVKDGVIVGCDVEGKGDYGKTITLQFENEDGEIAWAFYAHLSEIGVSIGDKVKEGEILGKTGTTGNAKRMKGEDQHLHFEYRIGGAKLGTGLTGRGDPNIIVDTKFEPDPNNEDNVRIKEGL